MAGDDNEAYVTQEPPRRPSPADDVISDLRNSHLDVQSAHENISRYSQSMGFGSTALADEKRSPVSVMSIKGGNPQPTRTAPLLAVYSRDEHASQPMTPSVRSQEGS